MARHGENIRRRTDGRWEGRYPKYSEEKGRKVYHSVYGKTYQEVKNKMVTQKNRSEAGKGSIDADVEIQNRIRLEETILEDAAIEWLEEVRMKRKRSTYIKYRFIYNRHIKKGLCAMKIHRLTDSTVRDNVPQSLSGSTRKSIYCVINQILKFVSQKYSVPVAVLKSPAGSMQNKSIEILNRKEQADLLSVLYYETDFFKMAILLCLYTGLRLGEVCALKWTDIDLENRLVTVNRTVQRLYAEGHRTKTILLETPPKSEFSRREIPLCANAFDLLVQFHHQKEYVFGGKKPMEPRTLQNHFKRIIRATGLPSKNFHILRHTFATNCVEGGTDVKSLSEILGHADVQITLNRYVHPTMDIKRKHMNALSAFYGQIYGQSEGETLFFTS